MKLQHNDLQDKAELQGLQLNYELAELWEFERGTDEATAVKSALGDPAAESGRNIASLPLIIVGYDARRITDLLVEQRRAPETNVRPIAVVGLDDSRPIDPLIDQFTDLLLPPRPSLSALMEAGRSLNALSQRVHEMPLKPADGVLTLLQLLYSRNQMLEPIIDADAFMAYDYPLAGLLMDRTTESALETMEDLAHHDMLESERIDRIFVCPDCHTYRVPVKELCTQCHSSNLSMEDSIHHFRCGYVAPEPDFMAQGKPVCPKCHTPLRHIGVEYNRPGHFSICHDCGHWASEPGIRAWCVTCNTYHLPGELAAIHIKRFKLSQNGIHVARAGSWDPNAMPALGPGPAEEAKASPGDDSLDGKPPGDNAAYTKDLTRLLISVADNNQNPMTVYRVDLDPISANDDDLVQKVEKLLCRAVRNRDLVARIETGTFLMVLPQGAAKAPDGSQIGRYIARKLDTEVDVDLLDPDNAADLLAQA